MLRLEAGEGHAPASVSGERIRGCGSIGPQVGIRSKRRLDIRMETGTTLTLKRFTPAFVLSTFASLRKKDLNAAQPVSPLAKDLAEAPTILKHDPSDNLRREVLR